MCSAHVTQSDWRVVKVQPLPAFCLHLTFQDGIRGSVDMSALIHGADAGVLAALRDVDRFRAVRIEHGAGPGQAIWTSHQTRFIPISKPKAAAYSADAALLQLWI